MLDATLQAAVSTEIITMLKEHTYTLQLLCMYTYYSTGKSLQAASSPSLVELIVFPNSPIGPKARAPSILTSFYVWGEALLSGASRSLTNYHTCTLYIYTTNTSRRTSAHLIRFGCVQRDLSVRASHADEKVLCTITLSHSPSLVFTTSWDVNKTTTTCITYTLEFSWSVDEVVLTCSLQLRFWNLYQVYHTVSSWRVWLLFKKIFFQWTPLYFLQQVTLISVSTLAFDLDWQINTQANLTANFVQSLLFVSSSIIYTRIIHFTRGVKSVIWQNASCGNVRKARC